MDVHRPAVALVVVAPDEVEEVVAAVYLAGVAQEELYEVELPGRQFNGDAVFPGGAFFCVYLQAAALQHGGGGSRRGHGGAPEQGADARLELQDVERLCDIVVRAGLEAQQLVRVLAPGCEHDDGDGGKSADLLAGFQPVQPRHHEVQDNETVVSRGGQLHGALAVVAGVHGVALVFEVEFDALYEQFFVVHDEYLHESSS